jgi:hypothetical protein
LWDYVYFEQMLDPELVSSTITLVCYVYTKQDSYCMRVLETMFLELPRSIKLAECGEDYVQHITLSGL